MEKKPDITLPELAKIFDCTKQSVFAALKKAGITRKKKTFAYAERGFLSVMIYVAQLCWFVKVMNANKFVFVDESGINRECRRLCARAKRGVKVCEKVSGKRTARTNIIAGLVYGQKAERRIAAQSCGHSTKAAFFEDWFEFELIPLRFHNAPVIMDNASFRRKMSFIALRTDTTLTFCFCLRTARNTTLSNTHG